MVATVALLLAAVIVWLRVCSGGQWPKSLTSPITGRASRHTSIPISSKPFDMMKLQSFPAQVVWCSTELYCCWIADFGLWAKYYFILSPPHSMSIPLSLSGSAVEQLLSPGCSLPYPGVIAARELLKRQKSQDLPEVSRRLPPQYERALG